VTLSQITMNPLPRKPHKDIMMSDSIYIGCKLESESASGRPAPTASRVRSIFPLVGRGYRPRSGGFPENKTSAVCRTAPVAWKTK
jgi:hypothetical protein